MKTFIFKLFFSLLQELEGSISQFGKVSVCKIYPEVDESIAYIRSVVIMHGWIFVYSCYLR